MTPITHHIRLSSKESYGVRLPPSTLGALLLVITESVQRAIRMRCEGRSIAKGRRAAWLDAASDIRFVGHYGDEETVLVFEAPTLGETAEELFRQPDMFSELPRPEDTGFDLLGDLIADVATGNPESDRFDTPLLSQIVRFRKGLNGDFQSASLWGNRYEERSAVLLNADVLETARHLRENTPRPQRVRISGHLDMIRASTLSFALKLASGQEVRGGLQQGDAEMLQRHFQSEVVVLGKAVFRPSGRLLRIDADELHQATQSDRFFSETPKPVRRKLDIREIVRAQQHKKGLAAIIGKWPGNETEEEIERALMEVS